MSSSSLVQLALAKQSCTQRVLAQKMGVSPAQISKWKNGEYISSEMAKGLRDLAATGEMDPDFVALAGSSEDAQKWLALIRYLANIAEFGAETGYDTAPLVEEVDDDSCVLFWHTLNALQRMGVEIPKPFPMELDVDFNEDDEGAEAIWGNEVASLIYDLFKALTNVYGFYAAYVFDLIYDDELDLADTPAWELEDDMIPLAASKLDIDIKKAPLFIRFKNSVESDVEKKLQFLKRRAFRASVPLQVELLDLVYESHEALGHAAEGKSLGFNARRLHPDVYMNELLEGMRVIHQVLPAIMKKLGIDEEFKLDPSQLRLGARTER